jgi:hypothetical protein
MTPVLGVVAVVGLIVAWFIARSTAKAMRRKKQQRRIKRPPARVVRVKRSTRSEMRAGEDPTTIAGEMNTTTRPGAEQPERK